MPIVLWTHLPGQHEVIPGLTKPHSFGGFRAFRRFAAAILLLSLSLLAADSNASSQPCAGGGPLRFRLGEPYSKALRDDVAELRKTPRRVYEQQVSAFQAGLAALEQRNYPAVHDAFARSVQLVPTYAAIFNLALAEQLLADFSQSKAHYLEADSVHPDDPELATNLGLVLDRLGQTDRALRTIEKALQLIGNSHSRAKEKARVLLHLGMIYYWQGNLIKALEVFRDAEVAFEHHGCLLGKAIAASKRANTLFDLDEAVQGEKQFLWAIEEFRTLHMHAEEAQARTDLGLHYLKIEKADQALPEFTRSVELAKHGNHALELARALNGTGTYYLQRSDRNQALPLFQEALREFQKVGDPSGEAQGNNNLASVYHQAGNEREALACSLRAISLYLKANSPERALTQFVAAGQMSKILGDSAAAVDLFEKALGLASEVPNQALQGRVLLAAAEFHLDKDLPRAAREATRAKGLFDATDLVKESAEATRLLVVMQHKKIWRTFRIALPLAIVLAGLLLVYLISIHPSSPHRPIPQCMAAMRRFVAIVRLFRKKYKAWARRWAGLEVPLPEMLARQRSHWKKVFVILLIAASAVILLTDFFLITYPDLRTIAHANAILAQGPLQPDVRMDIQRSLWTLNVCVVVHIVAQAVLFCL